MANYSINATVSGLGTFALGSVPEAGRYVINGVITAPGIGQGSPANSQVVVVVKKNASTIYTSDAGDSSFYIKDSFAANDAISIVISSALASDAQKNVIKTSVNIYDGER